MTKSKFLSVFSMNILKVTDTRLDVTLAGGLYHRFPWRHLPPPHPSRDLYFCEYYALPSRIFRDLFARMVQVRLPDRFWWGSSLDCKTVRICGCSSTREQSNKRSGKRLKTESETWEETLKIRTVRFAYVIFVRITRFSQPRAIRIGKISMQAVNKLSSNVTARDE